MQSYVLGTGSYLPEKVITNAMLSEVIDTSDEWIRTRSGISQRHIAADNESCSDMAEYAARAAITSANISPRDIDLIIVATTTPTHIFPSTAIDVQKRLGTNACPAFDIQAVCSGFVYALDIADKYIKSGSAKNALVIGSETMSKLLNWEDRSTCVLFGDGAGAVILSGSEDKEGIISSKLFSDGRYKEWLWVPNGVSYKHSDKNTDNYLQMAGSDVFKFAVTQLKNIVDEVLIGTKYTQKDIDKLLPHQANIRIIKSVAEKLNLPMEKVITTIDKQANTSAASIPLALDYAVKNKQIIRDDLVIIEGFGGGFTWGGILLRY